MALVPGRIRRRGGHGNGEITVNEALLAQLGLSERQVDKVVRETWHVMQARNSLFRAGKAFPDGSNGPVILVDDGLASGYTMLVCIDAVRKKKAAKILVAVHTGSARTIEILGAKVDQLICPNVRTGYPFAVADAYRVWRDLTDDEVPGMPGRG